MIYTFLHQILRFVYPATCLGCGTQGTPLCTSCLRYAKRCTGDATTFSISIYSYKDTVKRRAIILSKFYHRRDILGPLARRIAEELTNFDSEFVIVPIPMTSTRMLMRGYNHAEELSRQLAQHTHLEHKPHLLIKSKATKRQVATRGRAERLSVQRNSFTASREAVGTKVLLVDDVTTTGSTLIEARKALLVAGAKEVLAVTVAH